MASSFESYVENVIKRRPHQYFAVEPDGTFTMAMILEAALVPFFVNGMRNDNPTVILEYVAGRFSIYSPNNALLLPPELLVSFERPISLAQWIHENLNHDGLASQFLYAMNGLKAILVVGENTFLDVTIRDYRMIQLSRNCFEVIGHDVVSAQTSQILIQSSPLPHMFQNPEVILSNLLANIKRTGHLAQFPENIGVEVLWQEQSSFGIK